MAAAHTTAQPCASARSEFLALVAGERTVEHWHAPSAADTLDDLTDRLRSAAADDAPAALAARDLLLAGAPFALLDGCWLAAQVDVRRAHTPLGAALLDAFSLEGGDGDPARHHGNAYRALLDAHGLRLPDVTRAAFAHDARLREADLAFALPGLRLARLPDEQPAAIGYHAAVTLLGPPAPLLRAASALGGQGLWLDAHTGAAADRARALAWRLLDAFRTASPGTQARLVAGAHAHLAARRAWLDALAPPPAPSPWQAMLELVERKARHARGFHRAVLLDGRSLDAWLAPHTFDAAAFLEALARSPWVVPGAPHQSALLTDAIAFGGPMFGVFTPAEVEVTRAWILALRDTPQAPVRSAPPPLRATAPRPAPSPTPPVRAGRAREVYHRLLSPDTPPAEGDALARLWFERALSRARRAVTRRSLAAQDLWPFSAARLERWLEARLEAQIAPDAPPPAGPGPEAVLERAEVVWLLTQLAPAALVDGAWLAGMAAPAVAHLPVAIRLFQIYRDELGAGVPDQHHGNVMRRVLAAQGVTLPAPESRAFVELEELLDESFSTPALWLAIARLPTPALPELLGLNLAVELAGVGTTYERAARLLWRHGIDPIFFELHNSIDNADSGHTAWSAQALTEYVEGSAAPDAVWLRVWQGYAAYGLSSRPLVRALALRLGPRLAWRWLRRRRATEAT